MTKRSGDRAINPFHFFGLPSPPNLFIGRRFEIDRILGNLISPNGRRGAFVSGPRRIGKTCLLQYLAVSQAANLWPDLPTDTYHFIYLPSGLIAPFSERAFWSYTFDEIGGWLRSELKTQIPKLGGDDFPSRYDLIRFFASLAKEGLLAVVLLDGFGFIIDQIGHEYPWFLYLLRELLSQPTPQRGFSMIATNDKPLAEWHRSLSWKGTELYHLMEDIQLKPLDSEKDGEDIEKWFDRCLQGTSVTFSSDERSDLLRVSGGYPEKLVGAAYDLFENKTRDVNQVSTGGQYFRRQTSTRSLSPDDRDNLIKELANIPEWKDGQHRDRISVLLAAGLPELYVRKWMLDGAPDSVAARVINDLEKLGQVTGAPEYTVLGLLVKYLQQICPDIEGKKFLAALAIHYHMTTDQTWVDELNQDLKEEA